MSTGIKKDALLGKGKTRSGGCTKKNRERSNTKRCSLLPAHAFSPNGDRGRITQKKGLYAFGKTSMRVSRDIYFAQTEESAARDKEDLHKIIDLANYDHKSAKHADWHIKEQITITKKAANGNLSMVKTNSKADSGLPNSQISEAFTISSSTSNSSRKKRRLYTHDEPSFQVQISNIRDPVDIRTEGHSPMLLQASLNESSTSTIDIPSDVLEDATNHLLKTISMKFSDLMRNADGNYGNRYYRQTRQHLQQIHQLGLKANVIPKLALHGSICDTPSFRAGDTKADEFQVANNNTSKTWPLCQPVDHRVKIPLAVTHPIPSATSDHHDVEQDFFPAADISNNCNCRNKLSPFISSDSPKINRRQLYPSYPVQIFYDQSLKDPVGLDILDYANVNIDSNIFPVQEDVCNLSPVHSDNKNDWRPLPVVSPIKLPPFSNPSPRYYRRKLF